MIKLNPNSSDDIEIIYHLSDIHIRNDIGRHDEYKTIFDRLFSKIRREKKRSLIVVCGDIVHNKTVLRPECINLVKYFFHGLANISDVIVISGNHDCNINNRDSMNSLEPIIGSYFETTNKIYLLDDNEVYEYNNIAFGITNIYASKVTPCKIKNKVKVALYHGTIHGATVDNNFKITNNNLFRRSDFGDYDYVMLGDIHKYQFLKKNMAYSSSLVQQNYGETIENHGYIRWNVIKNKYKFHHVPNDYGFIIAKLNNEGLCMPKTDYDIKYPRIKILYNNVTKECVTNEISKLRKKYKKCEIITQYQFADDENDLNIVINGNKKLSITEIKSADDVKDVVRNYIEEKGKIKDINEFMDNLSSTLDELQYDYNSVSKSIGLNSMSFGNLFSYGKNNVIDFTNFNKVVGVVAKNGYGKSSIVDSILFGIYGKYSRGERYQAVNSSEKNGNIKISVKVNDDNYEIKRDLTTTHKKNDRKNNYVLDIFKNDNKITDDDKKSTNNRIENDICSYDDLVNTSFILQNGQTFIDMDQIKRKDYLCRMLNLDIFDLLMKRARFKTNSLRQTIVQYEKDLAKYDLSDIQILVKDGKKLIAEHKAKKQQVKNKIDEINEIKIKIKFELKMAGIDVDLNKIQSFNIKKDMVRQQELMTIVNNDTTELNNITNHNHDKFISKQNDKIKELSDKRKKMMTNIAYVGSDIEDRLNDSQNKLNSLVDILGRKGHELKEINLCNITEYDKISMLDYEYSKACDRLNYYREQLNKSAMELKEYKGKYDKLKNHKINRNCKACMSNQISKDKLFYDGQIYDLELRIENSKMLISRYEDNVDRLLSYHVSKKQIDKEIATNKRKLDNKDKLIDDITMLFSRIDNEIREVRDLKGMKIKLDRNNIMYDKMEVIISRMDDLICKKDKAKDLKSRIEENSKIIHKLETKIACRKKINDIMENYDVCNIDDKINEYNNQLINIENKIETESNKYNKALYSLDMVDNTKNKINELNTKREANDIIAKMMNKEFIDYILNDKILPIVQHTVNHILGFISDFSIKLEYGSSGLKVMKVDDMQYIDASCLCGFERFITNIAFRLAFNQINTKIKTNFLIIDEGFSCCDEDNLNKLKSLFEFIRKKYKWCLVITHIDEIKNNFDKCIGITREHKKSNIRSL
jgi:DNA repair exonuclease SbcCD ATPase subunit